MVARAGHLITYFNYGSETNVGNAGNLLSLSVITNSEFRGRKPYNESVGGANATPTIYVKRARDLGSGPPPVYTYWVTDDINSLPLSSPPIGPWGEIKVVAKV